MQIRLKPLWFVLFLVSILMPPTVLEGDSRVSITEGGLTWAGFKPIWQIFIYQDNTRNNWNELQYAISWGRILPIWILIAGAAIGISWLLQNYPWLLPPRDRPNRSPSLPE